MVGIYSYSIEKSEGERYSEASLCKVLCHRSFDILALVGYWQPDSPLYCRCRKKRAEDEMDTLGIVYERPVCPPGFIFNLLEQPEGVCNIGECIIEHESCGYSNLSEFNENS